MQLLRFRRKKIYYSAGMISLVILPILLSLFLYKKGVFKKYHYIEINTTSKEKYLEYEKTEDSLALRVLHKMNYVNYLMDSNSLFNHSKIENAKIRIKKMIQSRDYNNGIRFQIENTCSYNDYVKVLNSIIKTDDLAYAMRVMEDDVLVFYYNKKKYSENFNKIHKPYRPICATGELEAIQEYQRLKELETFRKNDELMQRFKDFYISYILIALMFILQIMKLILPSLFKI